jgi:hypothetical protein
VALEEAAKGPLQKTLETQAAPWRCSPAGHAFNRSPCMQVMLIHRYKGLGRSPTHKDTRGSSIYGVGKRLIVLVYNYNYTSNDTRANENLDHIDIRLPLSQPLSPCHDRCVQFISFKTTKQIRDCAITVTAPRHMHHETKIDT